MAASIPTPWSSPSSEGSDLERPAAAPPRAPAQFRTGLNDAELGLTAAERREFE